MKKNLNKAVCGMLCVMLCFATGSFAEAPKSPEQRYLESLIAATDDYKTSQLGPVFRDLTRQYYEVAPAEGRAERMAQAFQAKDLDPIQANSYQNFIAQSQEISSNKNLSKKQKRARTMELASTLKVPRGNAYMDACSAAGIFAVIGLAGAVGFGIAGSLEKYKDHTVVVGNHVEEVLAIEKGVPVVKQTIVEDTETITSDMDDLFIGLAVVSGITVILAGLSTFGCGG